MVEFKTLPSGEPAGYLRARDPADGFKYTVQTTASEDWPAVWIFSPCYLPTPVPAPSGS